MAKPKRDPVREERIHEEVIEDAYGPAERAIGWYYYLDDKIRFPFQAKCIAPEMISPLQRGESVEVRAMAVPLSQLSAIDPDEVTHEAIQDWHYWPAQAVGHAI